MKLVLAFVLLVNALYLVSCQNDGRYRPPTTTTRRPIYRTYRPFDSLNRNRNPNDGRYVGGNDGRYRARNDGRYAGGNDGRYVHVDNKYQHTGDGDRGQYSHVGGPSGSDAGYRGGSGGGAGSNLGVGTGSNVGGGAGSNDGASGSPPEPAAPAAVPPPPAPAPIRIPTTVAPAPVRRPTVQVASGPSGDGWKIIHLDHRTRPNGYNYIFETENGINAEESGKIETTADGGEGLRSTGFYQYVGDDGQLYRVDYVADNNGFVPQGDHIPKTPPAIEKLLQYLASQPKQ